MDDWMARQSRAMARAGGRRHGGGRPSSTPGHRDPSARRPLALVALAVLMAGSIAQLVAPDASAGATQLPAPNAIGVQLEGPPSVALGSVAQFSASASGGTPPYNIAWSVNGTAVSAGGAPFLSYRPLLDGVDRVAVLVRDAAGRQANASTDLLVTGTGPISLQLVYKGPSLDGGAEFAAQASGGAPPYRYLWQGVGAPSGWKTVSNWTTPPLPAGTFTFRVTAMDQRGYRTQSAPLTVKSSPRTVTESFPGILEIAIVLGAGVGVAGGALVWVAVRRRARRRTARR